MNKLDIFENKAIIPFITCGDPSLEDTKEIITALARGGAAAVVVGIPFSDPTAEGPIVGEANIRALTAGVTTDKVFETIEEIKTDIPLILMTYANVVFSYGTEKFMQKASGAGVCGLILNDVPYEEMEDFAPMCKKYGVTLISAVSDTSVKRGAMISAEAEGFVYGTISPNGCYKDKVQSVVNAVKGAKNIPCVVSVDELNGDNIKNAQMADGVVITTEFVKTFADSQNPALDAENLLVKIKELI